MAMDYMAQQQGRAHRVYGDPTRRGRPGEFDFIYVVTNSQGRVVEEFLVEAKGGAGCSSSSLLLSVVLISSARRRDSRRFVPHPSERCLRRRSQVTSPT